MTARRLQDFQVVGNRCCRVAARLFAGIVRASGRSGTEHVQVTAAARRHRIRAAPGVRRTVRESSRLSTSISATSPRLSCARRIARSTAAEPTPELTTSWSEQLRTNGWVRRIDVVRSLCSAAGIPCALSYSDPWQGQVSLTKPCVRKTTRDLGAVMMFFSNCPRGVNCNLDWANTHASGMAAPHRLFGFAERDEGFYNPDNPGFWARELMDARWAGLQFLLLNTYGPDLNLLGTLNEALASIDGHPDRVHG